MKQLLFELLDKAKPYDLIKVVIGNNEFYICREDSFFPITIRFLEYDPEMENSNYFYSYSMDTSIDYVKSHKVNFRDRDYLIETEIININYYPDYIHLVLNCASGISDYFIPYDSITYLSTGNSGSVAYNSKIVCAYNKLSYELNKGGY